jgi:hypothetical protein
MVIERGNKLISGPPNNEYDTVLKGFEYSVKRFPNNDYLGTRDATQEGRPYTWRTFKEVDEIVTNLAKGMTSSNLFPTLLIWILEYLF